MIKSEDIAREPLQSLNACFSFLDLPILEQVPIIQENRTRHGRSRLTGPVSCAIKRGLPSPFKQFARNALKMAECIPGIGDILQRPAIVDPAGIQILNDELSSDISLYDLLASKSRIPNRSSGG
jgi:hypothetical protein